MYNYDHEDLFYQDGTYKEYVIMCMVSGSEEPVVLHNEDLKDESFEHYDTICNSESLTFANCVSNYVKFTTYYTERLLNSMIAVYEIIEDDSEHAIPIGIFIVDSDNLSSDGKTREIIAYDYMYDVINSDVTGWYNSLEFPVMLKDFRDAFFEEFGIEQDNSVLINDDIMLPRQFSEEDTSIDGATIVKAISEINGVFPHIGKDGILNWISLNTEDIYAQPLYPSSSTYPSENTFPGVASYEGQVFDIYKNYYKEDSVVWGNYTTYAIDGIQVRDQMNEIAYQTNEGAVNPYTIYDNFMCYELSEGQLETIATRLYSKIRLLTYVPYTMERMGDPCLEVGDRVIVHTQENVNFVSYIFDRQFKGILAPFEKSGANGTYYLNQYDIGGRAKSTVEKKVKDLDKRVGNMEKSGSGPLQILSVPSLPTDPQLNVLYLIQGEVSDVANN